MKCQVSSELLLLSLSSQVTQCDKKNREIANILVVMRYASINSWCWDVIHLLDLTHPIRYMSQGESPGSSCALLTEQARACCLGGMFSPFCCHIVYCVRKNALHGVFMRFKEAKLPRCRWPKLKLENSVTGVLTLTSICIQNADLNLCGSASDLLRKSSGTSRTGEHGGSLTANGAVCFKMRFQI